MGYRLGTYSRRELDGVHPDLVRVVELAITHTEQDFTVHDGIRTDAEQLEYVRRGVSRTLKSRHLEQPDGYGHAVDLVPYINGRLRWEWHPIYKIVDAVRNAANELGVTVVWGGCWRTLNGTTLPPWDLKEAYEAWKISQGDKPFADGPHFEIRPRP